MAKEYGRYTAADLYGADGHPRAADIHQDQIFDCYFVAPMGALAERQPDRIREAVAFNAETGDFTVRLYRPPTAQERGQGRLHPIEESIVVSQTDVQANIRERGGGTADNNRARTGPLWPTVIEAAFAELYGRDPQGRVDLERGYRVIGDVTGGGSLSDGMYALTGDAGRTLQIKRAGAPPMRSTGPDHVAPPTPPGYNGPRVGEKVPFDAAVAEVERALAARQPVSMSTQGRDVPDGLEASHAYMVMGIARDPQTNDTLVTLRNPYADNLRAREGDHNVGAGWNPRSPEITVRLDGLVRDGSFGEFNIGPAPRVRVQQPDTPGSVHGAPAMPPPAPAAMRASASAPEPPAALGAGDAATPRVPRDPLHEQAEAAVRRLDASMGKAFDSRSACMAASMACLARENGFERIDHVVLNVPTPKLQAGENVFVVQGGLTDATNRVALMKTQDAIATPVEQSLDRSAAITHGQTLAAQQQEQDAPARQAAQRMTM